MADFNQNTNTEFERFNSDGTRQKNKKEKKGGSKTKSIVIVLLLIGIIVLANSMVITRQNQFKLIRQFGRS